MSRPGAPILVVKIGTNALLGEHEAPRAAFERVAESIRELEHEFRVVLVTSGAIGFGVRALHLSERPTDLSKLQALAMVGQAGLLNRWREAFADTTVGQVLVTRHDLAHREASDALRSSIEEVWAYGAVPVVNENDAVSHEEISFGDNDQLAAEISSVLGASLLVLLTDQDGIQAEFGTLNQRRLATVTLSEIGSHIAPTKSALGKGGFVSKVIAARHALEAGVDVYIGRVSSAHDVADIIARKTGTRIVQ